MPDLNYLTWKIKSKILNRVKEFVDFQCKITNESFPITTSITNILNKNLELRNRHRGKRAFVIANGPSLATQDITGLGDEITFVSNGFWKHPVNSIWNPKYYSLIDPTYFKNTENIKEFHKCLNEVVKESTFLFPYVHAYSSDYAHSNYLESNVYYTLDQGSTFDKFDITKQIQGFQSVSAYMIAMAVYMGCNPIYLLGFDHDYLAHRGIDHHFYHGSAINGHRNSSVPLSQQSTYMSEMESMLKLWRNYYSINNYAKNKNVTILNATNGGYLDVFPRVNFSEIFDED